MTLDQGLKEKYSQNKALAKWQSSVNSTLCFKQSFFSLTLLQIFLRVLAASSW